MATIGFDKTDKTDKKRKVSDESSSQRKSEKRRNEYALEFKAPVFQLETAIKNMSYTVDTFCKKMGDIEKCSNRLFYGLWLLLDIYVNGKNTNVNIKKDSLLTKNEFASQTIKLTGEIMSEETISRELVDVDDDLNTAKAHSDDSGVMDSQQMDKPIEDVSSPVRIVKRSSQTAESKGKEAEEDIKRFMLYYMKKKNLDMNNLGDNFDSVKAWLENGVTTLPEILEDNNAHLHELYVKVFKTHGYFFGGMRDAINNALNTKLPKSQAIMAGMHNMGLSVVQEEHEFIQILENHDNLEGLLGPLRGENPEKFIFDFNEKITKTLTDAELDQEVSLDDEEEKRVLRSYLRDVTDKMRAYVEEINKPEEQRNTADIKKDINDLLQKLKDAGTIVANSVSEMDVDDDSPVNLKNKFFKNNGFEKLRRDFFSSLEIEIKYRSKIPLNGDMKLTKEKEKEYYEEQEKMKKFLQHYKEKEVTIDGKKVGLTTGCMVKHKGTNPPSRCKCCSVIEEALTKYENTSFEYRKDHFSLAALIKEIFDETVYILDDDNPLLRKVGEDVKIDMVEWRKKHIMGGLLEHMTDPQRMEERKYRSWITSCLMPVNEDGSLFKNEYEHVFPVLFLFLFVGGYIHMPSTEDHAGGLKTRLLKKLKDDEETADDEYKREVASLAESYKNNEITKEGLEKEKRRLWEEHRIKKGKIYKVVNLLNAIKLFPFNDYNYNLLKFMFDDSNDPQKGDLKLLDYIVDTIFLFRESVLLCESDPNQYKSNAIYAKVSADPTATQLWSSSNQGITRFMIPIEQRIQAIDYKKSIEMNRRAKVTALYAGNDTDVYSYASSNMGENTGALSESLVNASHPIWVECGFQHLRTKDEKTYDEHVFELILPQLSFTKTKKGDSNITIRDFYTDFNADVHGLIPGKKLAFTRPEEEGDSEIYFFSGFETGYRVILKKGDSFNLIQYLDGVKNTGQHVIESVEYEPVISSTIQGGESQQQGTIKITFRCYRYESFTNRSSSPSQSSSPTRFEGGSGKKIIKKKRTKKKRRKKKKTRGRR